MAHPELIETTLGDETVVTTVPLAGDDSLVITPTRSLLYRAEGLISDETVEEFPHAASRLSVDEGRRKAKIRFEYPIDDPRTMAVPPAVLDSALHYVLAGVLNAGGVTDRGEAVQRVFRFNELTVVVTDRRLVTHLGSATWDDDYDAIRYTALTGLEFEEGSVATQVVLYMGGRSQRIKVPNDRALEFKQELSQALIAYFNVSDLDELADQWRSEEDHDKGEPKGLDFSGDIEPLGATRKTEPVEEPPQTIEWPDPPNQTMNENRASEASLDLDELESVCNELEEHIQQQRTMLSEQVEYLETLRQLIDSAR